ncbi:MAG: NAD(P)/FAD-dependent oxidoreductase [Lachnospiraceae bacterium]
MGKQYDVIIVGAGAAGLIAAISASQKGASVLLLEHMESAGKKILVTGNGKCNFTNMKQGISYYRGSDPAFVLPVMEQFGIKETLTFFETLGIYPQNKRDGYFYPASGQSSSMVQVLLLACKKQKVTIQYNIGIRSIQKQNELFVFNTKQEQFQGSTCIIATGGKSGKKTGSDGSGIPYIRSLGHHMTDMVPALVQLQGKQSFLKEIAGIRAENKVELYIDGKKIAEDTGELQLTEFGVSGIPIFQISRFASYGLSQGKKVFVQLNFLPSFTLEEVQSLLEKRFLTYGEGKTSHESLIGLFPEKLIGVLLKEAGIVPTSKATHCKRQSLIKLSECIQHLHVDIVGTKGFESAQVTAGGVNTKEILANSMESVLLSGLYFAGEVVDIDGMCGGYNLQWAWSSGWVAGSHAAQKAQQKQN